MKLFVIFASALFCLAPVFPLQSPVAGTGHYWRDYEPPHIPVDALIAGKDKNGHQVHIGQVYIPNVGLEVTQINEREPGIKTTYGGNVYKTDKFIKILCGNEGDFIFLASNKTIFPQQLETYRAVIGGHRQDRENSVIYIGKTQYHNHTKIGRVDTYGKYTGEMRFEHGNTFHVADTYELLIYNNK